MEYTIKQVAEKLDLTTYTLRYYEKEGLLPFVERDNHGHRLFHDHDIEWLMLICCLRATNMSVGDIKLYVALCLEGDQTIESRRQIIVKHKWAVEQKITEMNGCLTRINKKLGYYDQFINGQGTNSCNPQVKDSKH
jgi:DNA-binding transcriptional MerR regulator